MKRRTFLKNATQSAIAFGVLRNLGACRSAGAGRTVEGRPLSADQRLVDLRDRYFLRTLQLNPVTSTFLGGDGYDPSLREVNGKLRDFHPDALAAERAFYRSIERERKAIDPSNLSPAARVDFALLTAQVGFVLHEIDDLRYYERAVDSYVAEPFRGVDWQLQQMADAGNGLLGTEEEWTLVAQRIEAIPTYLETARGNLFVGKSTSNVPDWRMVERDGIAGSKANADYFRSTLPRTARGFLGARPFAAATAARLDKAGAAAAEAWTAFAAFLGATYDLGAKVDHFAVGAAEYEYRVRNYLRDGRTAGQLYEYGAQQVALYERKIYDVAREVARDAKLDLPFGTPAERQASVRRVMDHLAGEAPRDDDELFRWYREAGERAVAYGREQNLFDIPATYQLDVVPTPPVLRSTIDAAYYPAPPYKHAGVGRFYLTPTENDPARLKENNRASVADTAIHEGFPGHDWHYKYMTRHLAEISNIRWLTPGAVEDSSSMWSDSMAAEGWALYSEELMAEPLAGRAYGFYTPAEFLYELQGQLLRAVRVRVDVGLHTGRMTFAQAVDYFTEHVNFYPSACAKAASDPTARAICETATRAIYRYSKWPTQAITYNLGKNAIIQLRDAYKARQGARYSPKAFHQRFMRMGTIPVAYFRDSFLK